MLSLAMLFWIGYSLNAPVWYWFCWGFCLFFIVLKFGITCYKKGREL